MQAFHILLCITALAVGIGSIEAATLLTTSAPIDLTAADAVPEASELAPSVAPNDFAGAGHTACSFSSADLDECIRGLIQLYASRLKQQGVPEYSMGSIDPYFYKRGIFRYSNDGIQGGLLIKNMEIVGISDLRVNSVASNFTSNGFVIKLGLELPQLKAGGHFKADVKFGGLRLVPKGPFNVTIDNVKATVLTDGHIETLPNGQQRLSLHRFNANVNVGHAQVVADGIFSDRNLNAMILNLVNQNLPEITRVGIPATREQWAPILVEHINQFFAPVPIEKFLVQ
ncbi:putative beta-carotene-binding protein [Drosophila busckii]|uniref:putative beta-carotene-binding protein n=1 Tax=Drosophila busckii TaxID=30019 RepID=UPI0014330379|nr:putative beta-carotene-binding protein [Drosophila busckii]